MIEQPPAETFLSGYFEYEPPNTGEQSKEIEAGGGLSEFEE